MERVSDRHMGRRVQALLIGGSRGILAASHFNHNPDEFRILDVDKETFTYKVDGADYVGTLQRKRWRILKVY